MHLQDKDIILNLYGNLGVDKSTFRKMIAEARGIPIEKLTVDPTMTQGLEGGQYTYEGSMVSEPTLTQDMIRRLCTNHQSKKPFLQEDIIKEGEEI